MKSYAEVKILILSILIAFSFVGCNEHLLTPSFNKAMDNSEQLYTKQNIRYLTSRRGQRVADAINYDSGFIIPVNTAIVLDDVDDNYIVFIKDSREFILKNNERYTGMGTAQAATQFFSRTKVDLSKFNKADMQAINKAEAVIGASKEAILVAKGYPPALYTASINLDEWTYYKKQRGSSYTVIFKNNVVADIVDKF